MTVSLFIISYYSELCFYISAINSQYSIKTKDLTLNFDKNKLKINFLAKLKLITNCRPNEKMKRMVSKG